MGPSRAEPLREPARGEREHPELELGRACAVGALVGAAAHGEPAPPVALVAGHAWADRRPQLARELLRELSRGVEALPWPGMQGAHVDPLEQRLAAADRQHRRAQVALEPSAELRDQPDRVEGQHRHPLPAVVHRSGSLSAGRDLARQHNQAWIKGGSWPGRGRGYVRAEAVVATPGTNRPGCARSRRGTEFAESRFQASRVTFVRRQRPYRRSPRSRSRRCCSARAKRSSHRCRDKRCSVSSRARAESRTTAARCQTRSVGPTQCAPVGPSNPVCDRRVLFLIRQHADAGQRVASRRGGC